MPRPDRVAFAPVGALNAHGSGFAALRRDRPARRWTSTRELLDQPGAGARLRVIVGLGGSWVRRGACPHIPDHRSTALRGGRSGFAEQVPGISSSVGCGASSIAVMARRVSEGLASGVLDHCRAGRFTAWVRAVHTRALVSWPHRLSLRGPHAASRPVSRAGGNQCCMRRPPLSP
jgi:hypothetical protein